MYDNTETLYIVPRQMLYAVVLLSVMDLCNVKKHTNNSLSKSGKFIEWVSNYADVKRDSKKLDSSLSS